MACCTGGRQDHPQPALAVLLLRRLAAPAWRIRVAFKPVTDEVAAAYFHGVNADVVAVRVEEIGVLEAVQL